MFIRHLCVIFPQGSQCGHKRGPGNVLEFSKIPGIGIQEVKEGHNLIIDYLHYIRHSIMASVSNSLECNEVMNLRAALMNLGDTIHERVLFSRLS